MSNILLVSEKSKVVISPSFGAVLEYQTDNSPESFHWFRKTPQNFHLATDCACFPLIPFCNRIAAGKFSFLDKAYYTLVEKSEPNALHGLGWTSTWQVQEVTQTSCILHHICWDKNLYPFAYEAQQIFILEENNLKITIRIKSLQSTMPVGIGLHPYFTKNCKVQAKIEKMWQTDKNLIPTFLEKNSFCEKLNNGNFEPQKNNLDNSFTNWNGRAKITWENQSLEIKADPIFQFLACYSPKKNFFCLEPTSSAPDAFNLAAQNKNSHGTIILKKNSTIEGTVVFCPLK